MYRYDEFDARIVADRVQEFRAQVERRLSGQLTEDEFKPLRLQNGVYLQLHAYMLRIAIPYGTLSARQMRRLAEIAERYDRGYGHFTTRQNLQFNWPRLVDVPEILEKLAEVEMHCIQTSGNCIRNVTADHFAGVAADEIEDPRPTAELIRQWSTFHPEFAFLPRKFKIAVSGTPDDRAATLVHDIGLVLRRAPETGEIGYRVSVGGGLGRTPMIGRVLREFLPKRELLGYLEAILRVYNAEGRRDNKYKARIKILVHETGLDDFRALVEAEYAAIHAPSVDVGDEERARIAAYFAPPELQARPGAQAVLDRAAAEDDGLARFTAHNLFPHKVAGHAAVTISLKPIGAPPGNATADQMRLVADLADRFSLGEIRVSHEQNLILPHVGLDDVPALYAALAEAGLASANIGLVTDIIACPGLDYCALATARSIPIAQAIAERFADPARQALIGPLSLNISGCINACGHHHIGGIGILGLEKNGVENYQITLGGDQGLDASIGERLGPGVPAEAVPDVMDALIAIYLAERSSPAERFTDVVRRKGVAFFRPALASVEEGASHAAA